MNRDHEYLRMDQDLRSVEWRTCDVAVLACEVTNLTSLRLGGVAGWDLATNEWVEMA